MQKVELRPGGDRRVRAGHCWVFSNEIAGDVGAIEPGGTVEIRDGGGAFLGWGYANPASLITIRILSRDPAADVDGPDFYAARLSRALAWRQQVLPGRRSMRLVASEADGLPGLVVDRYASTDGQEVLAVQIGTLGMERRRPLIRQAIESVLAPTGVALRNESNARLLEGLTQGAELWWGHVPDRLLFDENGVTLVADVLRGQKTGFFFDQAENRAFAARCARGLRVLDLYANTGAWALGALRAGAREAVAVEINAATCDLIREGGVANGCSDRLEVVCGDVRRYLDEAAAAGEVFDAVYLDPPAFAKSRKKIGSALHAYRTANLQALRLVAHGGYLFTSSCSFHVLEERFLEEVTRVARRLGRSLRMIRRGEQGPDHPVVPSIPESRYLKHFVFQVE